MSSTRTILFSDIYDSESGNFVSACTHTQLLAQLGSKSEKQCDVIYSSSL